MKDTIQAQGRLADSKLSAAGLVLTQGGEPTFVPHDTSAPEWNIAALGPDKLLHARRLARELVARQFTGGVILQSFGKQYPGEPLPRWQVSIYRSRSGEPLWNDFSRMRLDQKEVAPSSPEKPQAFIRELAKALDLEETVLPAFEDFEATLRMTGSDETKTLLPRFSRRKGAFVSNPLPDEARESWKRFLEPAGWVLPLGHDGEKWNTAEWVLPDNEDLVLIPGDSPIGLRLPLNQLPEDSLKCGLTVEFKEDELIIFLPPLPTFSAFADLVRVIEALVTRLDLPPVRLEGYRPPEDEDLDSIALTSDPGVLEVNLPPSDNWDQFDSLIRCLYECAESVGLRGYKYQVSGRKVSTGGGAHIILGGPDLKQNPFIKSPTLLSSFLRFLQNHPSLSYAFSGLFMGPSSQAPRVDESAFDLPYELEIALKAIERLDPDSPIKIDAILRNLLMDWNGNTHRAELSVDKFYNFNASNGMNGLIEFRAFEMVPEPDMLLAPNVLLRALAACFAEKPYTHPLVDWREALHDRFALPCFLSRDLQKVIRYLNEHGFSFPANFFTPQLDFRFPVVTTFDAGGAQWSLRQALEPWPVMGDHQSTGRQVDSTTDRLELSVTGLLDPDRLTVSVNGFECPLIKVDADLAAGGIRYRLFDNPYGLQPHIVAHSPLRIEIIDRIERRVLHAIEYLNWRTDGIAYEGLPDSADEALQRVRNRLRTVTEPGPARLPDTLPKTPHAPYTLDLRRV